MHVRVPVNCMWGWSQYVLRELYKAIDFTASNPCSQHLKELHTPLNKYLDTFVGWLVQQVPGLPYRLCLPCYNQFLYNEKQCLISHKWVMLFKVASFPDLGPMKREGRERARYTLLVHAPDLYGNASRGERGIYGNVYVDIQYPTFFCGPRCMCKQCVPGPLLSLKGLGTRLCLRIQGWQIEMCWW